VLSGLEDGTYVLSVTAFNAAGAGEPAFVEVTVATATPPPTDPPAVDPEVDPVVDGEDAPAESNRALPRTGTEFAALGAAIAALLVMGTLILFAGWRSRPTR
jgi:hypothetical protein